MDTYHYLVLAHIAAGSIALLTFWIAAIARKGSPLHKRVGKYYLLAMIGIVATALPMALVFVARGRLGVGVFLGYLVVITASGMWLSWRSIQLKRDRPGYFNPRFRQVAWLNLLAGLAVFGVGLQLGSALLMGFCWVGVIIGIGMLRRAGNPPAMANWWLREHYGSMLGNGVATHIAFLGIGLNGFLASFGIPSLMLLPWFAPLLVAGVAAVYLDRRYGGQKTARRPSTPLPVGAGSARELSP
ncbi:MAG: hypothetical protein AB7E72_09100 [Lysobacterales bacterium]